MTEKTETALLAAGCFWGVQQLIRRMPGVISTRVGYSGGEVDNATYRNHGNHAEAVEIIFNPEIISFLPCLSVAERPDSSPSLILIMEHPFGQKTANPCFLAPTCIKTKSLSL